MTNKKYGKFTVIQFDEELSSEEIKEVLKNLGMVAGDIEHLDIFNKSFIWKQKTLVALNGLRYGGRMHVAYMPYLEDGKIDYLENIYGDRGKWGKSFYFLAIAE